MKGGAFQDDGR